MHMQVFKFYFTFILTGYLHALTGKILINLFLFIVTMWYEI